MSDVTLDQLLPRTMPPIAARQIIIWTCISTVLSRYATSAGFSGTWTTNYPPASFTLLALPSVENALPLRATGGDGSHMTVEDAISGQYANLIPGFAKPTFERLRRTRHSAQYFDPTSAEISADDSAWALSTARSVVEAVGHLLAADPPGLFE